MTDPTSMLGFAALGGAATVIIAFWQQVKGFLHKVAHIVLAEVKIHLPDTASDVTDYLNTHAIRLPALRRGGMGWPMVDKRTKARRRFFVRDRDTQAWLYKGRPVWFASTTTTATNGVSAGNAPTPPSEFSRHLRYIRGTLNTDKLISAAIDWAYQIDKEWAPRLKQRYGLHTASVDGSPADFTGPDDIRTQRMLYKDPRAAHVFAHSGRTVHDMAPDHTDCTNLDDMALLPEHRSIATDLQRFLTMEAWYRERGLSWKRGYLLEGPAGNGKTRFIRSLAYTLDLAVWVLPIGQMSNQTFRAMWHNLTYKGHPCIILLEDIDAVYNGREPVQHPSIFTGASPKTGTNGQQTTAGDPWLNTGVSFDVLLNALDGVDPSASYILFITTNRPERVDDALGGQGKPRPGRVDRIVRFDPPTREGREKIIRRILVDEPERVIAELVDRTEGASGAATQGAATDYVLAKASVVTGQEAP